MLLEKDSGNRIIMAEDAMGSFHQLRHLVIVRHAYGSLPALNAEDRTDRTGSGGRKVRPRRPPSSVRACLRSKAQAPTTRDKRRREPARSTMLPPAVSRCRARPVEYSPEMAQWLGQLPGIAFEDFVKSRLQFRHLTLTGGYAPRQVFDLLVAFH